MRRRLLAFGLIIVAVLLTAAQCSLLDPGIPSPDPNPTPGTVLIYEDFEPDVSSAFGFTSGNWEVIDGEAHTTTDAGATAHAVGGDTWTDYEVQVELKWEKPEHSYGPPHRGVIVRARGDVDKIVFWGSQTRTWFAIYKDGERIEDLIARNNQPLPNNCVIKVRVTGNLYQAYVNGNLVGEFETDARPQGTAGICVGNWTRVSDCESSWFDNFRVTALE